MDEDLATRLGGAVRQARQAKGMTQAVAAELVDLTLESFGRIERGRMLPSVQTLARLVLELGLSFDEVACERVATHEKRPRVPTHLEVLLPQLSRRALRAMTALAMELRGTASESRTPGPKSDPTGRGPT